MRRLIHLFRSNFFISCAALQLTLLAACATTPEAPLRGVTTLTDHVSAGGQAFTLAYMPDANKVSLHVIWPNTWSHSSGMPVVGNLGVELVSSGGAADRTAKKIKQSITALGSSASLVTTPDHIYGTFTASVETLDETISIVRDVVTEPHLDRARFDALKEAKQKRIAAQLEKPSSMLWSTARQVLLGDSTLTDYWNNTPVETVVEPITLDNIQRWHSETFTSVDVHVAVAGNINAGRAGATIDQLLSALPESRTQVQLEPQDLNIGVTVLLHDEKAISTLIAAIGLLPASAEGGEIADIVAVGALGKGSESRLLKAKAADLEQAATQGATQIATISASIANFSRDVRVFGINADSDDANASAMYELIRQTYDNFKKGNLDDQEVLRSVVPFANSLRSNDKKVDLIAYGLGQLLLDELPTDMLLSVMQDSLALKADEINQRIGDQYPSWNDMVKVVMSSDKNVIDADCVVTRLEEISQCEFE